MTKRNVLVMDGNQVKFRLEAERKASTDLVHIDWLRFTVLLRNVVPTFETLPVFTPTKNDKWGRYLETVSFESDNFNYLSGPAQAIIIRNTIEGFEQDHKDPQYIGACSQAFELAREVAQTLGEGFTVNPELKPGQDFYKYRISIDRCGHECAWVGFLAAGNGRAKASQDQSLHVNIQGHACTFGQLGWPKKMANLIDTHAGKITRVDLALDFFDGLGVDMEQLKEDYRAGIFNVAGKKPSSDVAGDWFNGHNRSLYIGSRQSGKITNIYEKGDALFGVESASPWVRVELRYGDQNRVLPTDVLRSGDSFFAGASNWHECMLSMAGSYKFATNIPQKKKLEKQTCVAEVTRNLRWLRDSAKATFVAALTYMDYDTLLEYLTPNQTLLPGRLKKFAQGELHSAYASVIDSFKTVGGGSARLQLAA